MAPTGGRPVRADDLDTVAAVDAAAGPGAGCVLMALCVGEVYAGALTDEVLEGVGRGVRQGLGFG